MDGLATAHWKQLRIGLSTCFLTPPIRSAEVGTEYADRVWSLLASDPAVRAFHIRLSSRTDPLESVRSLASRLTAACGRSKPSWPSGHLMIPSDMDAAVDGLRASVGHAAAACPSTGLVVLLEGLSSRSVNWMFGSLRDPLWEVPATFAVVSPRPLSGAAQSFFSSVRGLKYAPDPK